MRFPTKVFLFVILLSSNSFADLVYTGHFENEAHDDTTRLDTFSPLIEASLTSTSGVFTSRNFVRHQINSTALEGRIDPRVFFGIKTQTSPVLVSNLRTSFIGTTTYGGGGDSTSYSINFTGGTSILRHDDANGNGLLDPGEGLFFVSGPFEQVLGQLDGVGSINYNAEFGAGNETVLLAPNTAYVVLQDFFFFFSGSSSGSEPLVTIQADWQAPLARHETRFDFTAIPEAGSAALLFCMAGPVIMRRRRS